VRAGGRWTRRQALKNWLIAVAVRAAFLLADRLPSAWLVRAGGALGRAAGLLLPGTRARALAAATAALPEGAARGVARRSFERAGENLAVSLLLRRPSVRALDWVHVPEAARDTFARALGRGRGAVFVSAHVGPFELVAAAVAELGYRPAIVVRESYDPRLDVWVDAHRRARGADVIHRGHRGAAVRIVRALKRGQPVGFLPDLGGRVPSLPVTFLGRCVGFPLGPQKIAARLDCPLLVGWLRRELTPVNGCRFSLEIVELPNAGPVSEMTQRVADALSQAILHGAPEDWLWMGAAPGEESGRAGVRACGRAGVRDGRDPQDDARRPSGQAESLIAGGS